MELSITQEDAGHTTEGLPLYLFTLGNKNGVEIRISTLGGVIIALHAPDRHGHLHNIVYGKAMDAGIHLLPAPGHALHRQAWHAAPMVEDASVGLRLVSPGPHPVVASYVLDDSNILSLRCEASATPQSIVCLRMALNMAGQGDVLGQLLTLRATRVAPAGTHEQALADTAWDFRLARPLGDLPGPARFVLEPGASTSLRLLDPASGRQLEMSTDAASLRLGVGDSASHLWLEPLMAAAGGTLRLHFGTGD